MNKESKSSVLLTKFTNGVLNPERGNDVSFSAFEKNDDHQIYGKKRKLVLIAETGEHKYVGRNFGELNSDMSQQCRYMLGVRDTKTGKMTFHNAEILNMKPLLDKDDEPEEEDTKKGKKLAQEQLDGLTSSFGGKKRKTAMDRRQQNQLTACKLNDAVNIAVDKTMRKANLDDLIAETDEINLSHHLPPYNLEASTPAEAYPLDKLITPDEMESLRVPAAEFVSSKYDQVNQWEREKTYPAVILRHLKVLPMKPEQRLRKACMLMYLRYMLYLYNVSAKDIKMRKNKIFKLIEVPSAIEKSLESEFTLKVGESAVRTIPARLKDKLVCYILIICLHLDEFKLDVESILNDLNISKPKVTLFLDAMGCKIKKSNIKGVITRMATLPMPLTFKTNKDNRKKRARTN